MEAIDLGKTMNVDGKSKVHKPYVTPRLQRLSPAVAKAMPFRRADTSTGEVQQMIECVDQLHGAKGS